MIKRIVGIYYSPAGGAAKMTERLVGEIRAGLCDGADDEVSIECFDIRDTDRLPQMDEETLAVIGMPVYLGKIHMPAIRALNELSGNGAMAVDMVAFTGVSYGDALYELKEYSAGRGFVPVGAGAFSMNCGLRRDNKEGAFPMDTRTLCEFAKAASAKVQRLGGSDIEGLRIKPAPLEVKGKMPIHLVGKISPKAAQAVQDVIDVLTFKRKDSEWFL